MYNICFGPADTVRVESKRSNKSYSCVFLAQVHQRGLFALLRFFPCDISLSVGRKGCCAFGDSHLREGVGGRKDHFPSLVWAQEVETQVHFEVLSREDSLCHCSLVSLRKRKGGVLQK